MARTVWIVTAEGERKSVTAEEAARLAKADPRVRREDVAETVERQRMERQGSREATAFLEGALDTATLGGYSALAPALGVAQASEIRDRRELNPGSAMLGSLAPLVVPVGAPALAARAGRAAGSAVEGASALGRVGRTAVSLGVAGGVENAILGAGEAVSRIALSDDPMTVEGALREIGGSMVQAGGIGGVIGLGLGGAIGKLASRADETAKLATAAAKVDDVDDLSRLSIDELRAARRAEEETIKAARKSTAETLGGDLHAHWRETKEANLRLQKLLPEGADEGGIAARLRKSDMGMERVAQAKGVAARSIGDGYRVNQVLDALEVQRDTLNAALGKVDELVKAGKAPAGIDDAAAKWRTALARNEDLAARIEVAREATGSTRLQAIDDALARGPNALAGRAGSAVGDLAGRAVEGGLYAVGGALGLTPFVLGAAVSGVGGRVSDAVSSFVSGRLSGAGSRLSEMLDAGIASFLRRSAPAQRGVAGATKILSRAIGEDAQDRPRDSEGFGQVVRKRMDEVARAAASRQVTEQRIWDDLAGVRAVSPALASRMVATAMRRIDYLASKLPKRPPVGLDGVDRWRPSEADVTRFAKVVAAVADPAGRLLAEMAANKLTRDTVEAVKVVAPEVYEEMRARILQQLPELRKSLPYEKRLQLSILFGVPVDQTMAPHVIARLQATHTNDAAAVAQQQAPRVQQSTRMLRNTPTPTTAQKLAGGR